MVVILNHHNFQGQIKSFSGKNPKTMLCTHFVSENRMKHIGYPQDPTDFLLYTIHNQGGYREESHTRC